MRRNVWALIAMAITLTAPRPASPADLPAKADTPDEILLFNGKDFTGWTYHLDDPNAKMGDVWSIDPDQGIITCKGNPMGYIRTKADYTNYILRLEWRFNPVTKKAGNSGVLLRVQPPDKVWPKSIEAQLQSGQAGDFWLIDEARLTTPTERVDQGTPRHRLRMKTNEKPIGEWNQYEITVDGSRVTLKVNGEVLNEGVNAEEIPARSPSSPKAPKSNSATSASPRSSTSPDLRTTQEGRKGQRLSSRKRERERKGEPVGDKHKEHKGHEEPTPRGKRSPRTLSSP